MFEKPEHTDTRLSRRALLKLAGGIAPLTMPGLAYSENANARANDKAVWRNMSQGELNAAYDQSVYAANLKQILRRYSSNSKAVRKRIGQPKKARKTLYHLKSLGLDKWCMPMEDTVKLLQILVFTKITYAAEITTPSPAVIKKIDKFLAESIKITTNIVYPRFIIREFPNQIMTS